MANHNTEFGDIGEQKAKEYLIEKGFVFIQSNYRCRLGEIDLIFKDKKTLVFVEVKSRSTSFFGGGQMAVNYKKQRTIINVAQFYLKEKKISIFKTIMRFDIVSVEGDEFNSNIKHYRNAFRGH